MPRHGTRLLLVVGCLSALHGGALAQGAGPVPKRPAPRPLARTASAFTLGGAAATIVHGNRVWCGFTASGEQCVGYGESYAGAVWPAGSPDSYVFNGGPQVAAILSGDRATFAWAGDTVGAFFFDERGDQTVGRMVTGIFDSRVGDDLVRWPDAAYVRDPALFDVSLLGRKAASDEDSWTRYWDGEVRLIAGRSHPMGVLVDQRTLMWNSPYANRDILYVIHRLINVSARDPSRYAGLAAAGYDAKDIAAIARLGAGFQDSVAAAYGVTLPDTGFTWTDLYVAMGQDPDVGYAGGNYSTTVLPFATAIAYESSFQQPGWWYPPELFSAPFAPAPGFVGTRFLSGPGGPVTGGAAITMFTNTSGSSYPFPPRFGVAPLWRELANRLDPSDGTCTVSDGRPFCYLVQSPSDTRWIQATGPFPDVPAGGSVVFAIAYVFAAPVAAAIQTDGLGNALGSSAFELMPGIPATGPRLAAGTDTVRQIERAAGWMDFQDANGDGDIQTAEVRTVPYSLLHKAAVAQAFFDHRFVTPSAPAAPQFAVLPGDGAATVVWERSATESVGDPYFPAASDPLSPLYDPNYRRNDVEGYRVWRGRSLESLQLVAQFDYSGTALTDHTGQVYGEYEQVGDCAPEVGVVADCRADFLHGASRDVPLTGSVVQVPPGGRVVTSDGHVVVIRADTLVTGGASGMPALRDNGVPFAYTDSGLVNGETYVYAVTAFDANSVTGGATSLASERIAKTVRPRGASANATDALVVVGARGGDGTPLVTGWRFPKMHAQNGTFTEPIPPANGGSFSLPGLVPQLLPPGDYSLRIDSVSPGSVEAGMSLPRVYFSTEGAEPVVRGSAELPVQEFSAYTSYRYASPLVPYDSGQVRRFGVPFGSDARMEAQYSGLPVSLAEISPGVARAAYLGFDWGAARWLAHSRWYDDGASEPPDPTITPFASQAHTNGKLSGVSAIFSPLPYRLPLSGGAPAQAIPVTGTGGLRAFVRATIAAWYPADIVLRWGSGGQVTVRDSTHRVDLPFKRAIQPGYGFFSASAVVAAGVTGAQLSDGSPGVTFDPAVVSYYTLRTLAPVCSATGWPVPCVGLEASAHLQPVDVNDDGVADGNGIAFLVNGEPFFMLMAALPPAGTVWHLRAVGGGHLTADCTPALPDAGSDLTPGSAPTSCTNYAYTAPYIRPAYVPGLRYTVHVERQYGADTTAYDLASVHTVPDPLYFTNAAGAGARPSVRFVNLPERAVIRIYSTSGILVKLLTHNDPTAGGDEVWDCTNRGGRYVASGVYFYHVETPDHRTKVGRMTIVQQAWPR
jgi:hypothetical protein